MRLQPIANRTQGSMGCSGRRRPCSSVHRLTAVDPSLIPSVSFVIVSDDNPRQCLGGTTLAILGGEEIRRRRTVEIGIGVDSLECTYSMGNDTAEPWTGVVDGMRRREDEMSVDDRSDGKDADFKQGGREERGPTKLPD